MFLVSQWQKQQSCIFIGLYLSGWSHICRDQKSWRVQQPWFIQSERWWGFWMLHCPLPVTSPVCCSSKLPWEGPLLWPLLSAICCSRGTSTEVSHDRDCRSPGRSSSLSWEGSVVRSLQGRRRRRGRWRRRGRFGGLTRLLAQTHRDHKWNLNLNTWSNILSFKVKTAVMIVSVGKQRWKLLSEAVH